MLTGLIVVQALDFLHNVSAPGFSQSYNHPAFVPPPTHLALILTLTIHPSYNSRADGLDKLQASDRALQYLRFLQQTVGPLQAHLLEAYSFPRQGSINQRTISSRRRTGSPAKDKKEAEDELQCDLADEKSLWAHAEDFWAVVGWAFNCSIRHKKRWDRWQLWLDYMLDVLEADWFLRDGSERPESLIAKYVNCRGGNRRIARAIFADGDKKSLEEFPEIWKHETRDTRGKKDAKFTKVKIDIDEGVYGDYMHSSSEEDENEAETSSTRTRSDNESKDTLMVDASASTGLPDGTICLGGATALSLRLRLLALLSSLASDIPKEFTSLSDLFNLYLTYIRPHALPTFTAIICPPSLYYFESDLAMIILQYMARSLIETAAPTPQAWQASQNLLEKYYLPWAANTTGVADNAKFGACIECILRLYDRTTGLQWSPALVKAAESGIQRREDKAKRAGKKKGEAGTESGETDRAWLRASGERIRMIVKLAKTDQEPHT